MNIKLSLNVLGMLALIVFTIFTLIAVALYPISYNPIYNWLSNLGNVNLDHTGAFFFNLGCFLTGFMLIPFFLTILRWNPTQKWNKLLLIMGILLGIIASISLIGIGVFPETNFHMHGLAASGVFNSLFLIIIFINLALFKHPKFMKIVAYWGVVAVLFTLSFEIMLLIRDNLLSMLHPTIPLPGMEWAAVFTSFIWMGLLSYNMWKNDI